MILGTHTSDNEQNHLMIAEVRVPTENAEIESNKYQDTGNSTFTSPPQFWFAVRLFLHANLLFALFVCD